MSFVWMSTDYTVQGRSEHKQPIVYIFARDENGKRHKFKVPWTPYFYAPTREVLDDRPEFEAVDGKFVKRVDVQLPRDVPMETKRYSKAYEDKLPFPLRMLIDKGIRSGFDIVDGEMVCAEDLGDVRMKTMYVDIETEVVEVDGKFPFPEPEKALNMILTISYATSEMSFSDNPYVEEDDEIVVRSAMNLEEEKQMLLDFVMAIAKEDPDVVTGWNVIGFDLTYIYNRMMKLGINPNAMSPMNYVESMGKQKFKILGINVLNLDNMFKKLFQGRTFDSYKLDDIAALDEFIGWKEERFDYERYMNRENLDRIVPYTKGDVKKLVLLDRKLGLINTFDGVRRVAGCRLEDTMFTSMYADIAMLREFKGKYVLGTRGKSEREAYEGAYVHQPRKGVFKNVIMLDFAGMYPNIIMSYNISPETWVPEPEDESTCFVIPGVERGYFRRDVDGIFPEMIKKFMQFRGVIKEEMKEYSFDDPQYQVLDKRQYGVKQMVAALYGFVGFVGSRLYYPVIANSITALGRQNVKEIISYVEEKGYEVLYADTDSVLLNLGGEASFEGLKKVGEEVAQDINVFLQEKAEAEGQKNPAVIEYEVGYERILFSGKKKRYAGKMLYYKGKPADTLVIKGFEAKRSDSAIISREAQKSTLELILSEGTKSEVRRHVLGFIGGIRELPFTDVGIPKVIRKEFDEYLGNSKTALSPVLYANAYLGKDYGIGSRCYVFYVKGFPNGFPNCVDVFGNSKEVNRIALDEENFEEWKSFIDWEVQTQKVLEAKLSPILDAYGLSFKEIVAGVEQVSLEAFV